MADELKIVVDAEVELDKKQAEQEINSKTKNLDLDRVKIEGELDKEATRKNLNAAIRGIDGLATVKIKAEFEAAVSNKSINKAADQIRKSLSKLNVPVNIEVGKMATVSPSKADVSNIKAEAKTINEIGKALKNMKPVSFAASDTNTVKNQLLGMGLDRGDVDSVIKMIEEGGYKIENVVIKTGQRLVKTYETVSKMVKGKQIEVQEPRYTLTRDQRLQSLSVGGTTAEGLSVVKQVNWNDRANGYRASTTFDASLSETGQIVKDTKNASEKNRKQIEKLKREVSSIESRALKQVNPLEGGFASQMEGKIKEVRKFLNETENLDIETAKDKVSELKSFYGELKALQNGQNDLAEKSVSKRVAEAKPRMETYKQSYQNILKELDSYGLTEQSRALSSAYDKMTANFANTSIEGATTAQWDQYKLSVKEFTEATHQAHAAIANLKNETQSLDKIGKALQGFDTATAKFEALKSKLSDAGLSADAERVTQSYNEMADALDDVFESGSAEDWNAYTQAVVNHNEAMKQSRVALSNYNEEQRKQAADAKVAQKAQQDLLRLQKMQTEWSKAFKDPHFANQATQIKGMLSSGDVERMRQGSKAFQSLRLEIQAAGKAVKTLGDRFKEMFSKFTGWFSVSQLVQRSIQSINNMQTTVEEVDASMEDLEKVTTSTRAGYDEFLDEAKDKAKELHTSITSVVDATSGWSRLGYGLKDSAVLGEWSTIYKNVGDNVESAEAATKHLVSITKAFGTEGKSMVGMVESVVDRLNAVGNKTSISSGEIGTALQNSASALQNAGNTLSESIALTVGAYDITQDASETGNMWKTVSCDLFLIEKIRRYMLWRTNGLTSGMIG